MNIKNQGFAGIGVVIILIIAAVLGGGYYVYNRQASESVTSVEKKTYEGSTDGDNGIKVSGKITADVMTTVDCGEQDCFDAKFAACEPATMQSDIGPVAVHYKIIGPAADGCSMVFKYTKNPNPAWVNKEMTCSFDNKIELQKSLENTFKGVVDGSANCQGLLVGVIQSMGN